MLRSADSEIAARRRSLLLRPPLADRGAESTHGGKIMSDSNVLLFDWISFTTSKLLPGDLMEWLGLGEQDFESFPGRYGYRLRQSFGGIHILSDGFDPSMGVCVEMSGQGCRDWETFGSGNYMMLFEASRAGLISFTRIDVAFDDKSGIVPFDEVVHKTLNRHYCSIWRSWKVEQSNQGTSCLFGSRSSDIYCRIYDKAAERGFSDSHWIRIETVFKHDRAQELSYLIFQNRDFDQITYFGILRHYLNFCDPTDDLNPSRWPVSAWWQQLVEGCPETVLVSSPGDVYNLSDKEDALFRQYGNSMLVVLLCNGFDHFFDRLLSGNNWLRKKYREICRMYGCVSQDVTFEQVEAIRSKLDWLSTEYQGYDFWDDDNESEVSLS